MRDGIYEVYRCDVCGREKKVKIRDTSDGITIGSSCGKVFSKGDSVTGGINVGRSFSSGISRGVRPDPKGISNVKVPTVSIMPDGMKRIGAEWLDLCDECLEEIGVLAKQAVEAEAERLAFRQAESEGFRNGLKGDLL